MTGDKVLLKWEVDQERPEQQTLGKREEWAGSRGSSDAQPSQRLPRSLAAGDQLPKLKPHETQEQEGTSFNNKKKIPTTSSSPNPSPVSRGRVTGNVSCQELAVAIPKMQDRREKA